MYYSEGYVDRQTYVTRGHVWSLGMEFNETNCFFWCVLLWGMEKEAVLEERLSAWFYQELGKSLAKGPMYIQKELNRLGGCMKAEAPLLYLYFQNRMYFYGEDAHRASWGIQDGLGICISPEMTAGKKEWAFLSAACEKAFDAPYAGVEPMEERAARLGHALQKILLTNVSEGRIKQGYFFLWEERNGI